MRCTRKEERTLRAPRFAATLFISRIAQVVPYSFVSFRTIPYYMKSKKRGLSPAFACCCQANEVNPIKCGGAA